MATSSSTGGFSALPPRAGGRRVEDIYGVSSGGSGSPPSRGGGRRAYSPGTPSDARRSAYRTRSVNVVGSPSESGSLSAGGAGASGGGREGWRKQGHEVIVLNNPHATINDPTYFYWLYGSVEFRMNISEDEALKKATKQVDRLIERLREYEGCKGQLLYDIIATRKHIATGLPHKLGASIYSYVERTYWKDVTTTFVGITDNTARRVARDVFCRNKELSRQKYDFSIVDNLHMFIIYPPGSLTGRSSAFEEKFTSLGPTYVSVHELCKTRNLL